MVFFQEAIMGERPFFCPPSEMTLCILALGSLLMKAVSVKLRGLGFKAAAAAPSPLPVAPWQATQYIWKVFLPSAIFGFLALASAANPKANPREKTEIKAVFNMYSPFKSRY